MIRPSLPNPTPAQPAPFSAARTAQLAFFRAALDRVQAAETAPASISAAPAAAASQQESPVERYARPGALVDIRV